MSPIEWHSKGADALATPSTAPAEELLQTLILRLHRSDREQWQGQIIDARTRKTYRFASFVEFQRLLLKLRADKE